jgi:hypothetical protein
MSGTNAVLNATRGAGTVPNILLSIDASEQMRLTSTGLGIGTSSPTQKLDVNGQFRAGQSAASAYQSVIFENTASNGFARALFNVGSGGANGQADISYAPGIFFAMGPSANDTTTPIVFRNNNATERMRLDSSGNLGLGVTPSAWGSTYKAIESTSASGFAIASGNVNPVILLGNAYATNTGDVYKTTGAAARFEVGNLGAYKWFTAPSGTAGNAITFTQAMTLDASGNLLVGVTSANAAGGATFSRSGSANFITWINNSAVDGATHASFRTNGTQHGSISTTGSVTTYAVASDYRLKNITGPITNSGAYIDSLNPVEGTWKADGSTFVGLIAHEVQEASRTTVATGVKDGEEMQGMDYSSAEIIGNMIAELKSLRARVAALESN